MHINLIECTKYILLSIYEHNLILYIYLHFTENINDDCK